MPRCTSGVLTNSLYHLIAKALENMIMCGEVCWVELLTRWPSTRPYTACGQIPGVPWNWHFVWIAGRRVGWWMYGCEVFCLSFHLLFKLRVSGHTYCRPWLWLLERGLLSIFHSFTKFVFVNLTFDPFPSSPARPPVFPNSGSILPSVLFLSPTRPSTARLKFPCKSARNCLCFLKAFWLEFVSAVRFCLAPTSFCYPGKSILVILLGSDIPSDSVTWIRKPRIFALSLCQCNCSPIVFKISILEAHSLIWTPKKVHFKFSIWDWKSTIWYRTCKTTLRVH